MSYSGTCQYTFINNNKIIPAVVPCLNSKRAAQTQFWWSTGANFAMSGQCNKVHACDPILFCGRNGQPRWKQCVNLPFTTVQPDLIGNPPKRFAGYC